MHMEETVMEGDAGQQNVEVVGGNDGHGRDVYKLGWIRVGY